MMLWLALGLGVILAHANSAQALVPMDSTKTVLVIGRHPEMLVRVTGMLRANGYNASGARTNEEAIAVFQAADFKAVAIGGGVDNKSRDFFHREFPRKQPGVRVIDAHPQTILAELEKVFR